MGSPTVSQCVELKIILKDIIGSVGVAGPSYDVCLRARHCEEDTPLQALYLRL